jgi:hypothetical protein
MSETDKQHFQAIGKSLAHLAQSHGGAVLKESDNREAA